MSASIPKRFQPSSTTLFVDRFMTHFIKLGGLIAITAVFGIFIFIAAQIFPLFEGASVRELGRIPVQKGQYPLIGVDDHCELPFLVNSKGRLRFIRLEEPEKSLEIDPLSPNSTDSHPPVTSTAYNPLHQELVFGLADGSFNLVPIQYSSNWVDGKNRITQNIQPGKPMPLFDQTNPVTLIDLGDAGDQKLVAGVQWSQGHPQLHVVRMARKRTLMGSAGLKIDRTFDLSPMLRGKPRQLLVPETADGLVVLNDRGEIQYFFYEDGTFTQRQIFQPFGDLKNPAVTSMHWVFGDVSLVICNPEGWRKVRIVKKLICQCSLETHGFHLL